MRLFTRASLVAFLSTALACAANPGTTTMTRQQPPGAQDPKAPHPGSITAKYDWNHSTELWGISDLPDSFIFRCIDADGNSAKREAAIWCVPVVEVVTTSVDEHGKPVTPREADFIGISVYGPNHTFLEHTSSQPGMKRRRELERSPSPPSTEDYKNPAQPSSAQLVPTSEIKTDSCSTHGSIAVALQGPSWWSRIKAWLGFA